MSCRIVIYDDDHNSTSALKILEINLIDFEMASSSLEKIGQSKGYYTADSWSYVPIAIIGAGESGIAMGCRLKEALGFDQFRIFERQSGVGGTWYINRKYNPLLSQLMPKANL